MNLILGGKLWYKVSKKDKKLYKKHIKSTINYTETLTLNKIITKNLTKLPEYYIGN